jgi:lipopolysaccharide/colanic/teichoic acid biosynthesis glycosyltransferase
MGLGPNEHNLSLSWTDENCENAEVNRVVGRNEVRILLSNLLAPGEETNTADQEKICLASADADQVLEAVNSRRLYCAVKRGIDILFVLLGGPAVFLVIVVAAVAIMCSMGRPIFFVQERVGYRGRVFRMWKLRTMKVDPEAAAIPTSANDDRITPLGRFLRLSHLDELPQLWNILRGDMTLIGPRPEQVPLVEIYRRSLPHYELRHFVRPGLSGWAQVRYGYAETLPDTRRKLEYDLFYLLNFGPGLDLKITALTLAVLRDPAFVR